VEIVLHSEGRKMKVSDVTLLRIICGTEVIIIERGKEIHMMTRIIIFVIHIFYLV